MENKLKQQLRERMLGQLSSEKTEVDVNNAYEVAVEFALDFVLFCAENYVHRSESDYWWDSYQKRYTTKELLNKYLEL